MGARASRSASPTTTQLKTPAPRVNDESKWDDREAYEALLKAHRGSIDEVDKDGETPLHNAAMRNRIDILRLLLRYGANIECRNSSGRTPLAVAVDNDQREAMMELIHRGAKINAKDSMGCTPLHLAAYMNNADVVVTLLEMGADIDALTQAKLTPLALVAAWGQLEMVKLLVAYGATLGVHGEYTSPLIQASYHNFPEVAAYLIDQGADMEETQSVSRRREVVRTMSTFDFVFLFENQSGLNALHFAAVEGSIAAIQVLVEAGADVNSLAPVEYVHGFTPIHCAYEGKKIEAVRYLSQFATDLDAEADVHKAKEAYENMRAWTIAVLRAMEAAEKEAANERSWWRFK